MKVPALIAAALALSSCSPTTPPAPAPAAPLVASNPKGDTSWPIEFRWDGAAPAEVVRLRIVDEAEREILTTETRGDRLRAPDSLKASLRPGVRYQWRVARVNANGRDVDTSALTPFAITPAGAARTSP